MKIRSVEKHSTGSELGLRAGDDVLRINGQPVRDILDYRFLIAEETVEMEVAREHERVIYEIEKDFDDDLGLGFDEIQIRFCGNDCPFCFVDQNPAGMRQSLYFRDEDFRLSFLSGHYVTLTNLSRRDLERIVRQRLSPLFVSVHATEPEVRKELFGIRHDDHLLEKLAHLTQHGIEIHTQIVLCPEINDGPVLERTIFDLARFRPNLKSVSVVPVGLTKHRQGLRRLKPVTTDYARELLQVLERFAQRFRQRGEEHFVYAADEFYIMAGEPLPEAARYDGFYQKENGVGMVRYLLDDFKQQEKTFPARLSRPSKATFVTGTLAAGFMQETVVAGLAQVQNFEPELVVVENEFYGHSIRVTGLLTGQDIYARLKQVELGDRVFLPGNCVKDGVLFLDDWTVERLSKELDCPVEPLDNDFSRVFDVLS
ncbi:MAG: DUF512 domain-containing protein [Calditrichaeota bacterium]|nr:MAG: DUF512 domain-containing protein [Calditrichota bacterium]